jgi:hypothetical protein
VAFPVLADYLFNDINSYEGYSREIGRNVLHPVKVPTGCVEAGFDFEFLEEMR